MYVARLVVEDFRSYDAVTLDLDPGVTALVGANGQGKTNLVEAVGYVASHGSHRVAGDGPLVRRGAARAIIRAVVVADGRRTLVELEINSGRANRAQLNRAPLPRAREALGVLRAVLFAPEDLAIVKGDPTERRRYLDELLVLRTPRYAGVRADYERVLKQRNALLRSASGARGAIRRGGADALRTLDVWDAHLARHGAELLAARFGLVADLRPHVANAYDTLADPAHGQVDLVYRTSLGDSFGTRPEVESLAAAFRDALTEGRAAELERGVTLIGPHRDELVLTIGELPARGYASHGESWSFALALRLAACDLLRADGDAPVLLLDDVFAELDERRRSRLADLVGGAEQVLVTAAVSADVPDALTGARYRVDAGMVHRVD